MSKEGRGQPAHKSAVKPKGLSTKFGNAHPGGHSHSPGKDKGGLSGYSPGTGNVVPTGKGLAHKSVHHATHGGHPGFLGEHKLAGSHKISTRPMGAFKYGEVFGKGNK